MSEKKSMMAIAIAKSICKEYSTSSYSRVVYLENGQEFQIQLLIRTNLLFGLKSLLMMRSFQIFLFLNLENVFGLNVI